VVDEGVGELVLGGGLHVEEYAVGSPVGHHGQLVLGPDDAAHVVAALEEEGHQLLRDLAVGADHRDASQMCGHHPSLRRSVGHSDMQLCGRQPIRGRCRGSCTSQWPESWPSPERPA
jgi:hypothetical protein